MAGQDGGRVIPLYTVQTRAGSGRKCNSGTVGRWDTTTTLSEEPLAYVSDKTTPHYTLSSPHINRVNHLTE